jgi:hypothetical protein
MGGAAFLAANAFVGAAHVGGRQPWFFSALPSAILTSAIMFAAAAIAGWRTAAPLSEAVMSGVLLAVGAAVPLAITLFTNPNGPGTLFPLAIMFGSVLLACVSVAGAVGGWLVRRLFRGARGMNG